MDLEEFAQAVLTAVRNKADGAFSADVVMNMRNNGIKLTGISAASPDSNVGPVVYLEGYFREYEKERMGIGEIAEAVYQQIMEHKDDLRDINLDNLRQWEAIRCNIYAKLINAEMNRELLEIVPHRLFLDLAVVYYIRMDGMMAGTVGSSSILIHRNHMEMWGKEEEDLYQAFAVNMRLEGKPLFENMAVLLKRMAPQIMEVLNDDGNPVLSTYILTNQCRYFGAAELLDRHIIQEIGNWLEEDFVILPSSVHETIIIPLSKAPEYSELKGMVREVNREQLDLQERLSDHVYIYDRKAGTLKIVA